MSEPTPATDAMPATDAPPAGNGSDAGSTIELDLDLLLTKGLDYAGSLLAAVLILIVGLFVAKLVGSWLGRLLDKREQLDSQVKVLAIRGTRFLIVAFTLIAVLSKFGVQTASMIAVLGGLGLAIGLALQGSLSNIASGVMIMVLRPFTLGEVIKVGSDVYIIDDIGLFATRAHLPDGPKATIPNNKLWGQEIVNLTRMHNDLRRIDETFGIAYEDDIDHAFAVIKEVLDADERYLDEPEPLIAVVSLGDSSVNIMCRVWAKPADWWIAKLDLVKRVKQAFDAADITIPFPQRDVHIQREETPV